MFYLDVFGWLFLGLIIFFIWTQVSKRVPQVQALGPKVSPITVLLSIALTIAVFFLFNQIWNDLARLVLPTGRPYSGFDYSYRYLKGNPQQALDLIFVHTLFVVPLVVVAVIVYLAVKDKGSKFGAVTLPYFIGALVMLLRLLFDIGSFVVSNYGRVGVYLVLAFIIVVFSILIFYVQKAWERRHEQPPMST